MRPITYSLMDLTPLQKHKLNRLFVSNEMDTVKICGIIVWRRYDMITKTFILKKSGQLLLHLLFWSAVLAFFTYFFGINSSRFKDTLVFSLGLMPTTITTTYVVIYKLIPDYLIKKQYWKFTLYSSYTFIISIYLLMVSIFFSLIYISKFEYDQMIPATKNIIFICTAVYLVVVIVSAFKLLQLHLQEASKTKRLETSILDTQLKLKEQELNYLKMQIHPHFLFNTLNTMYGFALKKADETPEMILKLSSLLDYLLYQAEKPFVLLSEEVAHIKDYIALEKMRFNDTLNININVRRTSEDITIAPMLLIPFIENSFKHGGIKDGVLTITINIEANLKRIHFNIKNSNTDADISSRGIGLSNIKKRLELLYPSRYQLSIDHTSNAFEVDLQLKPKDNA